MAGVTVSKMQAFLKWGCRPLRAWPNGPHTDGLSGVFPDVHAAGKHDFILFRRLRTAELCEAFLPEAEDEGLETA